MDKTKIIGGGFLIAAGTALARETIYWLWGQFLNALTAGMGKPVTWASFPWFNLLGLVLMVSGLWLIFKHKPLDKLAASCAGMHLKMAAVYERLSTINSLSQPGYYPDVLGELASIYRSLEELRIPTPEVAASDIHAAYRQSYAYIGALMPIIRDKHVDFARSEASKIIRGIGAQASLLPPRWPRSMFPTTPQVKA